MQNKSGEFEKKQQLLRYVEVYRKQQCGERNCPDIVNTTAH